jgi:cytidine deaminase
MDKTWQDMYDAAKAVLNEKVISDFVTAGGVSAAVLSKSGNIYTGVCIDTASTLGICAERNAMLNMITNGENEIRRVLAIMPDGRTGAPCGACREFMTQLMIGKYHTVEIMLDYDHEKIVTLDELTPEWWL